MDWQKLFTMQEQLDTYIQTNHQINANDLFDKKVLALLVEVGELANETRCFKFWSTKAPSERSVILEEYVDGIHFILSIGIDLGYTKETFEVEPIKGDATVLFNLVYEKINQLKKDPTMLHYKALFATFLRLGEVLDFQEQDIQQAYFEKNKVNFTRQDANY
ncbi:MULTISPECIES: dUTP diphosphatase [Paraliobacillus]|uniref:dUTP diphosphatase n=1 Tax=Paraliobacillus TaxID=200903 RepID=UPI000DD3DD92|nr:MULTISPECIES: dUTP diphosphatase [Paraliobacillus]